MQIVSLAIIIDVLHRPTDRGQERREKYQVGKKSISVFQKVMRTLLYPIFFWFEKGLCLGFFA